MLSDLLVGVGKTSAFRVRRNLISATLNSQLLRLAPDTSETWPRELVPTHLTVRVGGINYQQMGKTNQPQERRI